MQQRAQMWTQSLGTAESLQLQQFEYALQSDESNV